MSPGSKYRNSRRSVSIGRCGPPVVLIAAATVQPAVGRLYPPPLMAAPPSEYIFTMHRVSRTHPPNKKVLEDISLSFYPGARIGVLGYNGAGKSPLLRIMAGADDGYRGEAALHPNATVGMLEQEPQLDPDQGRARATSRTAFASCATCSTASTSSRRTTPTRPQTSSPASRTGSMPPTPGTSTRMLETAMDALRLPPADADVSKLSGGERRRVALCRLLLERPRPAASRRADQPPRRRVGRLARAAPRGLQGDDRRRHPRPLLPRQRRRLDPRARPWPRHPLQGQLLVLARAEAGAPRARGAQGRRPPADDRGRARVGPREPQGPAQEVEGPARPLRGDAGRAAGGQARGRPDPDPGRPAPRRGRHRGRRAAQGLRRQAADRGPLLLAATSRDRRRDRRQRRRQDDPVPDDRRRRAARRRRRCGSARASSSPTSTSPATPSTATSRSGRRSPAASTRSRSGR